MYGKSNWDIIYILCIATKKGRDTSMQIEVPIARIDGAGFSNNSKYCLARKIVF